MIPNILPVPHLCLGRTVMTERIETDVVVVGAGTAGDYFAQDRRQHPRVADEMSRLVSLSGATAWTKPATYIP